MLKPKNIVIFLAIAAVLVLVYVFFVQGETEDTGLVSTGVVDTTNTTPGVVGDTSSVDAKNFLGLLLSVKSIKLDDSIFSDIAFSTLRDSSITLTPDGTEGRPNPFAPIGVDRVTTPATTTPGTTSTTPPTSIQTGTQTQGAPSAN